MVSVCDQLLFSVIWPTFPLVLDHQTFLAAANNGQQYTTCIACSCPWRDRRYSQHICWCPSDDACFWSGNPRCLVRVYNTDRYSFL